MHITSPLIINEEPKHLDFEFIKNKFERKITFSIHRKVYIRCRLSEAQQHRCCFCHCLTTEERGFKHSSTIEHVIPKSEGGTYDFDNLLMSCNDCNTKRGVRSIEVFDNIRNSPSIIVYPRTIKSKEEIAQHEILVKEFEEFGILHSKQTRKIRPKRFRRKLDILDVLKALEISKVNPFEEDTRKWRQFNRLSKSPYIGNQNKISVEAF